MPLTAEMIMTSEGQELPFARDLREAIGLWARKRWPVNTSLHLSKAGGISKATAKNFLKGHASDATITTVLRALGWEMAFPVIGAVIGQSADQFLETQRRKHVENAARLRGLARDFRAGRGVLPDRGAGSDPALVRRGSDRNG